MAPSATIVVAASATHQDSFNEPRYEHETKEDKCNNPYSLSHIKSFGNCLDVLEVYNCLVNRIFAREIKSKSLSSPKVVLIVLFRRLRIFHVIIEKWQLNECIEDS